MYIKNLVQFVSSHGSHAIKFRLMEWLLSFWRVFCMIKKLQKYSHKLKLRKSSNWSRYFVNSSVVFFFRVVCFDLVNILLSHYSHWADDKQTSWIIALWWLSVFLWRICITFLWPSKIFCIDKTVPGTKPPGGYNQDSCRLMSLPV